MKIILSLSLIDEDNLQRSYSSTTKQVGPVKKEFVRHITKDLIRDIM